MVAIMMARAVASVAVCGMGTACMYFTDGNTGVGWAILGLLLIWGGTVTSSGEFKRRKE